MDFFYRGSAPWHRGHGPDPKLDHVRAGATAVAHPALGMIEDPRFWMMVSTEGRERRNNPTSNPTSAASTRDALGQDDAISC